MPQPVSNAELKHDIQLLRQELIGLREDVIEVKSQVQTTNGRVGALERWRTYLEGQTDALTHARAGRAWLYPVLAGVPLGLLSPLIYVLAEKAFG